MATNFNQVKPGDIILSLEMNRRTMCPIMETCKVIRVSKEYTDRVGSNYGRLVKLEVTDSTQETYEVTLEAETNGSIFDKVFYSTSPDLIYQELQVQRQRAKAILDNKSKYELCIEECDKYMDFLAPPSKPEPVNNIADKDTLQSLIQQEISKSLDPMKTMVTQMYESLIPPAKPE